MKTYNVHPKDIMFGTFNKVTIIGATRGAAGASDFSDADTSQVFNLIALGIGDGVDYPLARAFCKEACVGTGLTNVQVKVGHTDDDDAFIAQGALLLQGATLAAVGPAAAAGGPVAVTAASKFVTATIDTTGANLNTLTAGEIWIYYNVASVTEMLSNRYA